MWPGRRRDVPGRFCLHTDGIDGVGSWQRARRKIAVLGVPQVYFRCTIAGVPANQNGNLCSWRPNCDDCLACVETRPIAKSIKRTQWQTRTREVG